MVLTSAKSMNDKIKRDVPKDLIEIGRGLGASGKGEAHDCDQIFDLMRKHCDCDEATVPLIHKSVRRYGGPITATQALSSLGAQIDFTDPNAQGALETYNTTGYRRGQFQTNVLVLGIGLHVYVPQVTYLLRGNAFPTSAYATPAAPSFSPDVWTIIDGTATTGAWGASQVPTMPSYLDVGIWARRAIRDLGLGFNMSWTIGAQRRVLDEILIDVMHMPADTNEGANGLEQVAPVDAVNAANAYYVSPTTPGLNSTQVFRPLDTIRLGAATVAGVGQFSPSLDLRFPDVAIGSPGIPHKLMCDKPLRMLTHPFLLSSGIDCGLICNENSELLGNALRNAYDANYGFPGTVPATLVEYSNWLSTGTTPFKERTLDGLSVSQTMPSGQIGFKFGRTQYDLVIFGFEFGDYVKQMLTQHKHLQAKLASECGLCCGWA